MVRMRNVIWVVAAASVVLVVLALWSPGDPQQASVIDPAYAPEPPPDMEPSAPAAGSAEPPAPAIATPPLVAADQPAQPDPQQNPFPHPSSPEYAQMLEGRFMSDPADDSEALENELTAKVKAVLPPGSR